MSRRRRISLLMLLLAFVCYFSAWHLTQTVAIKRFNAEHGISVIGSPRPLIVRTQSLHDCEAEFNRKNPGSWGKIIGFTGPGPMPGVPRHYHVWLGFRFVQLL